jgi:glutathione S-transferase
MLDSDTRTIRCILDLCEIAYDFKEINTLKGEHQNESYRKICPLQQVPMIVDGTNKVLGRTKAFIMYIVNKNQSSKLVRRNFPQENRAMLEMAMIWLESILRPSCRLVVRNCIGNKAFGIQEPNKQDVKDAEMDLFEVILSQFNEELKSKNFVCENDFSIMDIAFYQEIRPVTLLV